MRNDLGKSRDVNPQRKQAIDFLKASSKRRESISKESTLSEINELNTLQYEISAIAKKNLDGDPASLNPHLDLIARVWGEDDSRVKELREKFQDLQELDEQLAEATKGYNDKPKDPEYAISIAATHFLNKHQLEPVMLPYIKRLQEGGTVSEYDKQAQALLKECTSLSAQGYIEYINKEAQYFYDNQGKIDQTQGEEKKRLIRDVAVRMECALAYYHNYKDFLSPTKGDGSKPKDPEKAIYTALTRFLDKHQLEPVMLPYIKRLQKDKQAQALLKECTSLSAQGYIEYINKEVQYFYDNQGKIDQTQGKEKQKLIIDSAVRIECALAYYHNYKDFLSHTKDKIDETAKIYDKFFEDINISLKEIEISITQRDDELGPRTDGESHKHPSGTELHRTLPKTNVIRENNANFIYITDDDIIESSNSLYTKRDRAQGNIEMASHDFFVRRYSRTKEIYDKALEDMQDFKSLREAGKRDLASAKWEQWVQASQSDQPNSDVATLITNTIYDTMKQKSPPITEKEISEYTDISRIRPLEHLLKCYDERERQHWEKVLEVHYGGEFKGFRGEDAINKFYRELEIHAKDLIKNAKIFRLVRTEHLALVLNNRDRKFPTSQRRFSSNISKNQAMYGSSEFPIHAYMSDSDNGTLPPNREVKLETMGQITLRLKKDHVMERATLAFDDTMGHYWEVANELTVVPRPMTQLDRKVWPLTKRLASSLDGSYVGKAVLSKVQDPLAVRHLGDLDNYPEVQIHGDLKLSDVEKVFLPQDFKVLQSLSQQDFEALQNFSQDFKGIQSLPQQLNECGIEWEYL